MNGRTLLRIAVALVLFVAVCEPSASASDIDACKYLVVTDFTSDPYGIAQELRTQARAKGFTVVSNARDVSDAEKLKTCLMAGSWSQGGSGGNVAVRVMDTVSGDLVGERLPLGRHGGVPNAPFAGL